MTQQQYIINRKTNIVELGKTLGNISEACRNLGVSRRHYYDIKGTIEEEGLEGLIAKSKNKPRYANRIDPEIEKRILAYSLEYPIAGQVTVSNELKTEGIIVSSGGVRGVWIRHDLTTKALRLKRLEKHYKESNCLLTESQVHALEEAKEEKQAHGETETHHPGFLLGQDTYYVGYIKGIGKIYQQTGIDTYSNVGFAKLYQEKTALTAADFLNSKVLPYFDEENMKVLRTLTDRGTEYGWQTLEHPYQLFLHLNDIEHTRTKARHPQTNGCVERLNQIIQNEFYAVAFRKKLYTSLEEVQADLDTYMDHYNNNRTNQGKRCQGRTPRRTFDDGYQLYEKYVIDGNIPSTNCETVREDNRNENSIENLTNFHDPK
jgi:transposase InsO family protein